MMGNKLLSKVAVWVTATFISFATWAAAEDPQNLATIHAETGLACSACHMENPPAAAVGTEICTACHGLSAEIAERTAEIEPNPHASHKGDLPCASCHRAHEPSVDACAGCHAWGYFTP